MKQAKTLANFVGHNVYWGIALGAILGCTYYLILFQFSISFYILYAAFVGVLSGILLGGISALALGVATISFHSPPRDLLQYRRAMLTLALVVTFPIASAWLYGLFRIYSVTGNVDNLAVVLAAVLATFAAGYTSQRVSQKHLEQTWPEILNTPDA